MSNRARWKPTSALIAALGVGLVLLLCCKALARQEFLGHVDPATGYRCRCTFPADWHRKDYLALHQEPNEVDHLSFFAPSANPLAQLFKTRILHRSMDAPQRVYLSTYRSWKPVPHTGIQIQQGYPEPSWLGEGRTLTHRHFSIDGYPATAISADGIRFGWDLFHTAVLLIYIPDHALLYSVGGFAETSNHDLLDREMQSISASFHVEKVAVPTTGR